MATWNNKMMKGEWNQEMWEASPLKTMIRFDGGNYYKMPNGHVAQIDAHVVSIYHDFNNAYSEDERIIFHTVKIVPQATDFQGETKDQIYSRNERYDKRGHGVKTTLKDIVSYLNGEYVGEVFDEEMRGETHITFYKV